MNKIQLICFPYAGGSSAIFNAWDKVLSEYIEVVPIELSGRGQRFGEALYKDFEELIEDVYSEVSKVIKSDTPYVLFGHSMGAFICLELAKVLLHRNDQQPSHIFISGCIAPQNNIDRGTYKLSDQRFIEELRRIGGTPDELFHHQEILDLFLPILKNDFRLAETYHCRGNEILDISMSILYGNDMKLEELFQWRDITLKPCQFYHIDGGHLFLIDKVEEVGGIISETCLKLGLYA